MAKVLVVDDLQSELQLISGFLAKGGFQVTTAINGSDALGKVKEQVPDVIVTDLVMPDMSGLELCRKLKKLPQAASIPVVACTTKDSQVDQTWAKKQGIVAYLIKPCNQEQLIDAVNAVLK